ncbi:MAG: glycine zipper domain-containing protein [Polaromonas sp.]|jgi:hypothetical protein|nr:glycine zipper domain-containing protein [Polaromonas sp.]
MTRARKWLLGAGALALLGVLLASVIPSSEELTQRASMRMEAALGVPVSVGALQWRLLPSPRVVIQDVATRQAQPVEVKQITLYPHTAALWKLRFQVDRAEVEGAVLPQLALVQLGRRPPDAAPGQPDMAGTGDLPLAQLDFQDVTWISRRGNRVVFDGQVQFDAGWKPRTLQVRRPGVTPAADLTLTRQGQEDRWQARTRLGGGTADGELQLHTADQGEMRLTGQLKPRDIDAVSAMQAFNHRSIVAGKASGDTTLSARGVNAAELAQSLHTTTHFTMARAKLLRFDVNKAVRSAGKEHAGETPLNSATGQLDTHNTPNGMAADFTRLKASSGVLSVSGKARVVNWQIDGEFSVDLVDGWVGVPLKVSGPLEHVQVSVPAGAVAGAALGTAVLPGIGTAIGARLGAAIGRIFGSEPADQKSPAPARKLP